MTDRVMPSGTYLIISEENLQFIEQAAQKRWDHIGPHLEDIRKLIASHRLQAARIQELEKRVKELEELEKMTRQSKTELA